jgi:hypothetical protein
MIIEWWLCACLLAQSSGIVYDPQIGLCFRALSLIIFTAIAMAPYVRSTFAIELCRCSMRKGALQEPFV